VELGNFASDDYEVVVPYGQPEDGATVTIRYISREELRNIILKSTKSVTDPVTGQRTSRPDEQKFNRLFGEAAVRGWSGFQASGTEFPFTPENRDKLMAYHKKFSDFVMRVADDIDALVRVEREKIKGN
jgi:hypothetical protein